MAERASDRVLRLLGMVAYLDRSSGAPVEQLAAQFGVSVEQVLADVETLWLTGTPGYQPYDLIDFDAFSLEQGVVTLTESRGMTRPLRLGAREAVALLAALRALAEDLGPALDDDRRAVLDSALAKVQSVTGGATSALDVRLQLTGDPQVQAVVTSALAQGRRLRLRYVNAADRTSEREVDPIRLVTDDAGSYLLGWCLAAGAERLFRLDRVLAAQLLDVAADTHEVDPHAEVFDPDPTGELVTLHLRSRARWIAEQSPVEAVRNLPDGSFEVDLRVVSHTWVVQLLLGAADDVLDVRPRAVAEEVAATARAALDAYEEQP
ncbi:helix-turn-helix transcriptional regulator [Cellulomonas citrea]|uniref:helix-turn-helix transcriptional regulator n=1 Tax=Cellulomonas citrea TaxID=1909423 RepID=UPI001356AB79|nr:WYL domain-containing protein [Cellulomonas citrea]